MNDLDTLRAMRADVPPPRQDVLARGRARLLDEAARSRWSRPRQGGWQAIALAVAATVVVILGVSGMASMLLPSPPGDGDRVGRTPTPTPSPTPTRSSSSGAVKGLLARAQQAAARATPGADATDARYFYVKEVLRVSGTGVGDEADEMTAEFWFLADTGRTGARGRFHAKYETGHVKDVVRKNGQTVVTENGQRVDHPTQPVKAFRDDPDPSGWWPTFDTVATVPTNAADMLNFARHWGSTRPVEAGDFTTLVGLLYHPALRPEHRAAVYGALRQAADKTTFSLAPDVVDAAGRQGIGLVFDPGHQRLTLILDKHSYEFLGYETATGRRRGLDLSVASVEHGLTDSTDERP